LNALTTNLSQNLDNNTWAYRSDDDSDWLSPSATAKRIKFSNTHTDYGKFDEDSIVFGAKINASQAICDSYIGKVVITATSVL
jgi:hypothetical protein